MMEILILDLEATCYDRGTEPAGFYSEIIEIGAISVNTQTLAVGRAFGTFVKPSLEVNLEPKSQDNNDRNVRISEFCTNLTTIANSDLVDAPRLNLALDLLAAQYHSLGSMIFASWGDYDRNKLQRDCYKFNIRYPFGSHISLKTEYANFYRVRKCGMDEALRQRGLPLVGTHHRGIDDVHNISDITVEMLVDGWMPQCN